MAKKVLLLSKREIDSYYCLCGVVWLGSVLMLELAGCIPFTSTLTIARRLSLELERMNSSSNQHPKHKARRGHERYTNEIYFMS